MIRAFELEKQFPPFSNGTEYSGAGHMGISFKKFWQSSFTTVKTSQGNVVSPMAINNLHCQDLHGILIHLTIVPVHMGTEVLATLQGFNIPAFISPPVSHAPEKMVVPSAHPSLWFSRTVLENKLMNNLRNFAVLNHFMRILRKRLKHPKRPVLASLMRSAVKCLLASVVILHPTLKTRAGVTELERIGIREHVQINSVRIGHVVELRVKV
mmetsp:Transcript_19901/g.79452  ORF Transcript_19901/g.79452 Transcript_19901/m.79452 type:complete len:211 (-) Transcript_19901:921-1553(-)